MEHLSHLENQSILDSTVHSTGTTIEYPGNLKVYDYFNGCGSHPQFNHLKHPPEGYTFVTSPEVARPGKTLSTAWSAITFATRCLRHGVRPSAIFRFLRSRGLRWQKFMGGSRAPLMFFPSVPFHLNQHPWAIEIEDSTSLLYPFLKNGDTSQVSASDLRQFVPVFRALLESDQCRAVISHMKSTIDSLPILLGSQKIVSKLHHVPVGTDLPDWDRIVKVKSEKKTGPLILFSNSWHQHADGFFLRGGLTLLDAFTQIRQAFPASRLIIRSKLPDDLPEHYAELIARLGVEVIEEFLPQAEWETLRAQADYLIFPSARIHIVTLLEAMAYGMCVITTDGWGIGEYAKNRHNSVVVPSGQNASWIDWDTGLLRENYSKMLVPNPQLAKEIAQAFEKLEKNPETKQRLILQARTDVETVFSMTQWNSRLKTIFDGATKPQARPK
jgi:glycosyltransferase involved in cell wall biosynthesis